jgi:hypothetical protein
MPVEKGLDQPLCIRAIDMVRERLATPNNRLAGRYVHLVNGGIHKACRRHMRAGDREIRRGSMPVRSKPVSTRAVVKAPARSLRHAIKRSYTLLKNLDARSGPVRSITS